MDLFHFSSLFLSGFTPFYTAVRALLKGYYIRISRLKQQEICILIKYCAVFSRISFIFVVSFLSFREGTDFPGNAIIQS